MDADSSDFDAASAPIKAVLDRGEAEVLSMKPWDERRLAYEIAGRKRGLYVLTYFKMDPGNIAELERDIDLNEDILRALLLRKDSVSEDVINAETPATSGRYSHRDNQPGAADEKEAAAEGEPPAEGKDAPKIVDTDNAGETDGAADTDNAGETDTADDESK